MAFQVVFREELASDASILGGGFVLAIEQRGSGKEIFIARYVVQGHLHKEKEMLVHALTAVTQQAIRLLTSVPTFFGFSVWSEDMTLTCTQGAERILRKVYVKGNPEFQLSSNKLLDILRPLYGLVDSGDYLQATFPHHLKKDLGMIANACDMAQIFKRLQSSLQELIATHVDDTLGAGTKQFQHETLRTAQMFDEKPHEINSLTFASIAIETHKDGTRTRESKATYKRMLIRGISLAPTRAGLDNAYLSRRSYRFSNPRSSHHKIIYTAPYQATKQGH